MRSKVWIKDKIRKGEINFHKGQKVTIFRKKKNGYPKNLNIGDTYLVKSKVVDHLYLVENGSFDNHNGNLIYNFKSTPIKIHTSYVIPISFLRSIKIEEILKQGN